MTVSTWNGATGFWRDAADWSNGVPDASTDAAFTAAGPYTTTLSGGGPFAAAAVEFDSAGATLALEGSLTLGGVFDLQAGTLAMSNRGVIHGGTLMMDGGTVTSRGSMGGTLDGVHLAGALDLASAGEQLNITHGLTGTPVAGRPAEVELGGGEDSLVFVGSQTVDNTMIVLDDQVDYSVVYTKGTLTLGPDATLTTTAFGAEGVLGGADVINDGTIVAAASGAVGTLNIGLSGTFTNDRIVTANSDMSIAARHVVNAAWGRIEVGEDIAVYIEGGFSNLGAIDIADGGSVEIASDTTIANAGTITVNAGVLSIDQNVGSGVVKFTNTGAISVAAQGELQLLVNFTVASLGDIVDAGKLYIAGTLDNRGETLRLGSGPIFGGTGTVLGDGGLISGGTVVLGQSHLAYTGGGLHNVRFEGVIDLSAANATIDLDGGVAVTGANGTGPGVIDLTGAGAQLTFFDRTGMTANGVDNVTIDAGSASGAVYIQLVNFDDAAQTVTLGAHANLVSDTTGAKVIVANQDLGSYTLVNAGHIAATASHGTFAVSIQTLENNGQVMVAKGDAFTLTGALTGSGEVTIATHGVAEFGAAQAGQSVVFADATGTLKLATPASFAATLAGAVVGDRIDLIKTAATAASLEAGDQLLITDNGAAVATLQLSGNYADKVFDVASDGAGGSLITLANSPSAHGLAQAMASLGGADAVVAGSSLDAYFSPAPTPILAAPTRPWLG